MKEIFLENQKVGNCLFLFETKNLKYNRYAKFRCICGNVFESRISHVKLMKTISCGCLKSIIIKKNKTTHGLSKNNSEYNIWCGLKDRCYNKNNKAYKNYGGRGIEVCEKWLNSFDNFLLDMGNKPSPNHSIDRINNELGYCQSNCKWSTRKEQSRNTRRNLIIEYKGDKKCLSEWLEILNISNYGAILKRIVYRGWSIEKSFETPIKSDL